MAVTCKQIAEMIGVSRQAAASVLNNAPTCLVSREKKEKILQLARELNFIHNNAARTLRKGKSGLIGILTGGIHLPRTGLFLLTVDRILRANGYLPVIIYTRTEYDAIASGIKNLAQQNVDGLIVNGIPPVAPDAVDAIIPRLERSGLLNILPTILTNTESNCSHAAVVRFNYDNVIKEIVERCAQRDFERIQILIRKRDSAFEASQAMRKAASQLDLPIMPECAVSIADIIASDRHHQDTFKDIRDTLAGHRPGTLYLCDTGAYAIQTATILLRRSGKIPEDTGIIAFDHTEVCSYFTPGITSVQLDHDSLAEKSWELLRECMSDSIPRQIIDIPAKIIFRETF